MQLDNTTEYVYMDQYRAYIYTICDDMYDRQSYIFEAIQTKHGPLTCISGPYAVKL